MLYKIEAGSVVPWTGEPVSGRRLPANIEYTWSDEELRSVGLYKEPPKPPIPVGHTVVSESLVPSASGLQWDVVTAPVEITPYDVDEELKERADVIATYPEQVSMIARKVLLDSKAASGQTLTQAELDELQTINTALAAIDYLAKKAAALKAMNPIPVDYKQDKYWI